MDQKTIMDFIKEVLGDAKKLKAIFVLASFLAILMLISFQILPFLLFLVLAIISYLNLKK